MCGIVCIKGERECDCRWGKTLQTRQDWIIKIKTFMYSEANNLEIHLTPHMKMMTAGLICLDWSFCIMPTPKFIVFYCRAVELLGRTTI